MRPVRKIPFAGAALVAGAVGALIARESGISPAIFWPNLAALILGTPLLIWSPPVRRFARRNICVALALILLLLTFASPGLESVHRWIKLGPLSINVSMTLVPLILFAMSEGRFALGLPVALILLLQPDAGQATAFAIAAVIILQKSSNVLIRYGTSTCIVGLAIGSWFRSDPLAPIDHVERILHLAFANGILLFALAMFAIALLMWPFVLRLKNSRTLRLSFITYFATSFFVTEIGNFPVPLIGAGASSVMGWILAVSLID